MYLKSDQVEGNDDQISLNHKLGLYATYLKDYRTYCFYFNFLSGIYHYRNAKPWQRGVTPPQARRTGPEMIAYYAWDVSHSKWGASAGVSDEFENECKLINAQKLNFLHANAYDPVNVERLLNISLGDGVNAGRKV